MSESRRETPEEEKARQEENERRNEHKIRMRFDWNNLIDDIIEDGRSQGVFDNLRGKGKPLNLNKNPFDQDSEITNSLLKENKMVPAWLAQRNDAQAEVELLRQKISRTWRRYDQEYRFAQDTGIRSGLEIAWDDEIKKWEAAILKINKLIDSYNLKRPVNNLEMYKLRLDDELQRVNSRRFLRQIA
jgi:DnaJ family protein C protein 28